MSNLLPISQSKGTAHVDTNEPTSLSAPKRPAPVEDEDVESTDSEGDVAVVPAREEDDVSDEAASVKRVRSTRANKPTSATSPTTTKAKATPTPTPTPATDHTPNATPDSASASASTEAGLMLPKASSKDNMFFKVARVLLIVVMVMLLVYLVYWIVTHVYGIDVWGWARTFGSSDESGAGVDNGIHTEQLAYPATQPYAQTSPENVDVDNSPSSTLFKNIGSLFGASTAAAAAAGATTQNQMQDTTPHRAALLPPPSVSSPEIDHVHVSGHTGPDVSKTEHSYPLDSRKAETLLDLLAQIE